MSLTLTSRALITQLNESLWRVTRPTGEVLGYVETVADPDGTRYRAKRMIVRQQRFVPIGDFWSMEDAVECFG
jgi:hypothetical protein